MNLTGPGLTGVTVFTQRLLSQGWESHRQLLPPGFPLSFTACWSSSSQPQEPCFLVDSRMDIFSSPPSERDLTRCTHLIYINATLATRQTFQWLFPPHQTRGTWGHRLISATEFKLSAGKILHLEVFLLVCNPKKDFLCFNIQHEYVARHQVQFFHCILLWLLPWGIRFLVQLSQVILISSNGWEKGMSHQLCEWWIWPRMWKTTINQFKVLKWWL